MQPYPGTNDPAAVGGPWQSITFAPGYGVWPTGLAATGGDPRQAAQAMALAQAAIQRTNLLGNRVAVLNLIDGSTSNNTAAVNVKNSWTFTGYCGTSSTALWTFGSDSVIAFGKTMYVGDPSGFLGIGHIRIKGGSDITADGSGGAAAVIKADGANAIISALNGGGILVDDLSSATIVGSQSWGLTSTTSVLNQYNPRRRIGDRARDEVRVKHLALSDFTGGTAVIDASTADVWYLPTGIVLSGGLLFWTVKVLSSTFNFHFEVKATDPNTQGADVKVTNHVNQQRGTFYSAPGVSSKNRGSCRYFYDGADHDLYPDGHFDGVGYANSTTTFDFA